MKHHMIKIANMHTQRKLLELDETGRVQAGHSMNSATVLRSKNLSACLFLPKKQGPILSIKHTSHEEHKAW